MQSSSGMAEAAVVAENVYKKEFLKPTKSTIPDDKAPSKMKHELEHNEKTFIQEFPLLGNRISHQKFNDYLFNIHKVTSDEKIYYEELELLENATKAVLDAKTFVKICGEKLADARDHRQQSLLFKSSTLYHEVMESSVINTKENADEFYRETLKNFEIAKKKVAEAKVSVDIYHKKLEDAKKYENEIPLIDMENDSDAENKFFERAKKALFKAKSLVEDAGKSREITLHEIEDNSNTEKINKMKVLELAKNKISNIEISSEMKHKIINNMEKYIEEFPLP